MNDSTLLTRDPRSLGRRGLIGLGGITALAALTGCQNDGGSSDSGAHGSKESGHGDVPSTPADARAALEEGNVRFAEGKATHPHQSVSDRKGVADHQAPFALVHGCVDSRVSPELVFDQGVGDIFTTRTAGTILDDTIVGSMEFAASDPYAVPLIVLLGHTSCGAVAGTVGLVEKNPKNPKAPGEINDIIGEIAPVVRSVKRGSTDEATYINEVVKANVLSVRKNLLERSAILRKAQKSGKTEIVSAVYDLSTGKVTWLD